MPEPQIVKDKSQPIKIVIGLVALLVVGGLLFSINSKLDKQPPLGISADEIGFGETNITRAQVTCSATNVSTSVVTAQTGRTSFIAANAGANTIFLCRGSNACSATSGIPIFATSTNGSYVFTQNDGYFGPYVCRGENSDTALTVTYSQ